MNRYFIFLLVPLLYGCDLVYDKDISNEKITLLSPGDLDTNDSKTQYFWWEENKQIEGYRLQIVHPSFDSPSIMYLDTIIKGKFNYNKNLIPDDYQWRLRGENFSSKTPYITRNLHVDTSYNISQELVELTSPANAATENNSKSVTLRWKKIPMATSYEITVESLNSAFPYSYTKEVFTNEAVLTDLYTSPTTYQDITYRWTVTAYNNKSNTQSLQSQSRTFVVNIPDPVINNQ